jgi:hypothetical protein
LTGTKLAIDLEKKITEIVEQKLRESNNGFESKLKDLEYSKLKIISEIKSIKEAIEELNRENLAELKKLNQRLESLIEKML